MTDNRLPLYRVAEVHTHPHALPPNAHTGLWYNKFYRTIGKDKEASQDWVASVDGKLAGETGQIAEFIGRRRRMVEHLHGKLLYMQSTARFVTGMGLDHFIKNGFAWHQTLGTPYVPGSGIKGMVRAWALETGQDPDLCRTMFGEATSVAPHRAGRIAFLDALPLKPVELAADVMTPHYGPYYQGNEPPGDWHNPVPICFLTVAPGCEMQFAVTPRPRPPADDEGWPSLTEHSVQDLAAKAAEWLALALQVLGAGAKTATGYGRFTAMSDSACAAIGNEWVADLAERRAAEAAAAQAALPPLERARAEIAAMETREVLDCLRNRIGQQQEPDAQYRECLRQAIYDAYYDAWKDGGIGNLSRRKCREYLALARGDSADPTAKNDAKTEANTEAQQQGKRKKSRRPKQKKTKKPSP